MNEEPLPPFELTFSDVQLMADAINYFWTHANDSRVPRAGGLSFALLHFLEATRENYVTYELLPMMLRKEEVKP